MRLLVTLSLAAAVGLVMPSDLPSQGRAGRAGMSSIGKSSFGGGSLRGGGSRAGSLARGRGAGAGFRRGGGFTGGRQQFGRGNGPHRGRSGITSTGFRGTDRVIANPPRQAGTRSRGGGAAPRGGKHAKAPRVSGWTYDAGPQGGHRAGYFGGRYGKYNPYFYYGLPFVYAPYGYTRYRRGYYYADSDLDYDADQERGSSAHVYRVDPETVTESSSKYVIRVPSAGQQEPVTGTVFEVRPEGLRPVQPEAVGASPIAGSGPEATFHLIALKDGTIYASREHWLQENALHYVTRDGVHHRVTVDDVDLDLTAQVNRERGLPFVLEVREPAP